MMPEQTYTEVIAWREHHSRVAFAMTRAEMAVKRARHRATEAAKSAASWRQEHAAGMIGGCVGGLAKLGAM